MGESPLELRDLRTAQLGRMAGCPTHSRSVRMSGNTSSLAYSIPALVLTNLVSINPTQAKTRLEWGTRQRQRERALIPFPHHWRVTCFSRFL
jgi:hypothetical protein